MNATVYIDRDDDSLWVVGTDGQFGIQTPLGVAALSPGEAREVRDALTHWLDHLEDEADLRALEEARANDDGTRTPLRDFMEETDDE